MKAFLLLILLTCLEFVELQQSVSTGTFTVIAPSSIRRGKPFRIAIFGYNLHKKISFTIDIEGTTNFGATFKNTKTAKITKFTPQSFVHFETWDIQKGNYKLYISTDQGYRENRVLKYSTKAASVLIQTDKAIYFPKDVIRFRVFAIDSETKSVNLNQVDISIKDANGFAVTAFKNVKFLKGKFQGKLQLSERIVFGVWQVFVEYGGETAVKYIEIADYIKPEIISELKFQETVPVSLGILPIAIKTLSNNIDGIATVIFERFSAEYFKRTLEIKSETVAFDVNLVSDLKAGIGQVASYNVRLMYYDRLTGTNVTNSAKLTVVPQIYSIKIIFAFDYIMPHTYYTYSIVVQKYDGSPAPAGKDVSVALSFSDRVSLHTLDKNGQANLKFFVPFEFSNSSLYIEVSTSDASPASLEVKFPFSLGSETSNQPADFLLVEVFALNPTLNSPVGVQVVLKEYASKVYCVVTAKGILLESTTITLFNQPGYTFRPLSSLWMGSFWFTPTLAYVPKTNIICYYIKKGGRIITGSTSVELSNQMDSLSLSARKAEYKPGDNIEIEVESDLYSTVSLVAVDQRIATLKDGNSPTKSDMFDDLMKFYETVNYPTQQSIPDYEAQFHKHGLVIFTDMLVNSECNDYLVDVGPMTPPVLKPPTKIGLVSNANDFMNSILWQNIDIKTAISGNNKRGREIVKEFASINTAKYIVYGLSMSKDYGIGFPLNKPTVSVFRPFFIVAEFPYSIKRTETLEQSIKIYNFLSVSQSFTVYINKDPKYEIIDAATHGWKEQGNSYYQTVYSTVGVHVKLLFHLRAIKSGTIYFNIAARGPYAGDSIDRILKIDPLGVYQEVTDSALFILQSPGSISKSLKCTYPSTMMEILDVSVSISGDILGRCILGINLNLIALPKGCGEQLATQLFINILIWKYLKETNQLTKELEMQLREYSMIGYQEELTFLRIDGSFALASPSGSRGVTWLTSYVLWVFCIASDFIPIDQKIMKKSLDFMSSMQNSDGSFEQYGSSIAARGSTGGTDICTWVAARSYHIHCSLSLFPEYIDMYVKAISFVEKCWCEVEHPLGRALIAYALVVANSPTADLVIASTFKNKVETETEIYYDRVLTTAYALLIAVHRQDISTATKIAVYLVRKSNSAGGFEHTFDTVHALYALIEFAKLLKQRRLQLVIKPNVGPQFTRFITSQNALTVETIPLDLRVNLVDVTASATSNGLAVVTLRCGFVDDGAVASPNYQVNHEFKFYCQSTFEMWISFNFLVPGETSQMTIVMVDLPSGWKFSELLESPKVSITETSKNGGSVTFYLNDLGNEQIDIGLKALKSGGAIGSKGGQIRVVDYYEPVNQAFRSFMLPNDISSRECSKIYKKGISI